MPGSWRRLLGISLVASFLFVPTLEAKPKAKPATPTVSPLPAVDPAVFSALEWREVGPYRGGRSAAATGLPGNPNLYYMGATGGGVWKSDDAGLHWKNISDGFFGGSIGAVAVSEWDPNVLYVGTGEKTVRGNVSEGDGMWKSTDAGKTWKHIGLADSRHIPRVRIHPKNPDLVYAAVLGHLFGPNEERGVYRSKDGGASWERVLTVNNEVGAVDLEMDPTNPRILYATTWRVRRTPYSLESGGPGSGIWKSIDGGDSWQELSNNPGLPKGTIGIAGISVSRSNPENIYAIVEAEEGGVFRSKDGGKTWTKTNESRDLRQRAWYYTRIYADPQDEESVYVVNVRFHHSNDGGRTFRSIRTMHGDHHDLWMAPENSQRMIVADDGGVSVSDDGGSTWTAQDNQPTSQMYRVSTDNDYPYRLLGGQQDNSALRIRSRSLIDGGIDKDDWDETAGGESGHVVAKPDDPDVVYGGSYGGFLIRLDHESGQVRAVNVWPEDPMGGGAGDWKYRFQWNFPLFFSPHNNNTLYAAANVLFKTTDGGHSWKPISPDLTRNDPTKLGPSGGPITKDNTGVEYYCTIFAAIESSYEKNLLWAGSDDGLLHVSRDGGGSWKNVTPPELPEWSMINSLDADPFTPGGLYLAATRYKLDDQAPYLFKTSDYGATWKRIDGGAGSAAGIDRQHFTRALRADPGRKGLLYAGSERGMWVSFDDGARWQSLQLNLPQVPVTDLAVKNGDLVAATQGRGYWILDDLHVLHQAEAKIAESPAHFYAPRAADRSRSFRRENPRNMGTNPLAGAIFHYVLKEEPAKETKLELEIRDGKGDLIRTYTRKPAEGEKPPEDDEAMEEDLRQLPAKKGGNRFAWDLSYPIAETFPGMILWNGGGGGPTALPGKYTAKLTLGDWSATQSFELKPDPRSATSAADRQAQFDFVAGVRDQLTETHRAIKRIREAKGQLDGLKKKLGDDEAMKGVVEAAEALKTKMTAIEEVLYQTKNKSQQDPLNFPIRLNDKLAGVLQLATLGDNPPTESMRMVRDELTTKIDAELAKLKKVWDEDLPAFNQKARDAQVPVILFAKEKTP